MNVLFWIANGRQPEARMTATQEKYVRSFLLLAQLRIFIFLGHCCTAQSPPPSHCVCRLDVYAILFYSVLFEDIVIIVEYDGPLSSTIRRINIIFSIKIFSQKSFFFCVFLFFCLLLIWCCRCVYFFSSCARCWLLWTLLLAICYFFCQIKFRSGRSGCGKEWVSFCEKLASWAVLNATRPFFICFCCFCCCCCGHCSWMSSYSTS